MTQQKLADEIGISQPELGRLERGEHQLKAEQLRRLGDALEVPITALIDRDAPAIPVRYRIAAFGHGAAAEDLQPERPFDHYRPTKPVRAPGDCFGAEVVDDSASLIYPAGTVLLARRVDRLDGALAVDGKTKFIVAFYATNVGAGDLIEILVGLLDQQIDGSISLVTRSGNPELPHTRAIRRTASNLSLGESTQAYLASRMRSFDYTGAAADTGLILGRVERADRPE